MIENPLWRAGAALFAALLPLLYSSNSLGRDAILVRGEPLTASEILVLPPVCKLIVVEQKGIHHGAGDRALTQYAPLFEQPQYHMAKENPHLHHYCWALTSKQRYFNERDRAKREYYFKEFMGDIEYVLVNSNKNWTYFHVLLNEQAEMLKYRREYPVALVKLEEAIRFKPDNDKSYALKSDILLAQNDKKSALETLQLGLTYSPDSKLLTRRIIALGGKLPERKAVNQPSNDSALPDGSTRAEGVESSKAAGKSPESGAQSPAVKDKNQPRQPYKASQQDDNAEAKAKQPKGNPYCRFCP